MTRSNEKTPPRSPSPGAGRNAEKPGRAGANGETFGRFVGNLARLEGRADQGRKDQGRKAKEGGR